MYRRPGGTFKKMSLYKNKYRIESTRLKGWDYTNSGIYYVTICTGNMTNFFGNVKNGEIFLSKPGKIVDEEWLNTAVLRSNVILDEYVIMPNHFHGIIALEKITTLASPETSQRDVCTRQHLSANSLGSIINQFKGKCTKRINESANNFHWKERFHDRIIRNETELNNVREYIRYNPSKWDTDEFNIENRRREE